MAIPEFIPEQLEPSAGTPLEVVSDTQDLTDDEIRELLLAALDHEAAARGRNIHEQTRVKHLAKARDLGKQANNAIARGLGYDAYNPDDPDQLLEVVRRRVRLRDGGYAAVHTTEPEETPELDVMERAAGYRSDRDN